MWEFITFAGDTHIAIIQKERRYISITHFCRAIGLDRTNQIRMIRKNPYFEGRLTTGMIYNTWNVKHPTPVLMIPLVDVHVWIFGIEANKIASKARKRLFDYREECLRANLDEKPLLEVIDVRF